MLPEPGQIVSVRSRTYLVEAVWGAERPEDDTRVRLACLDDDAQGDELEVLWEREVDAELRAASWEAALHRGFDPPPLFSAWLHTLRWNCVTSTRPNLFQSPWRAGIDVKAYQLEPLRKALKLPRVNLFIADDVGLGKTIEAGLILRELIMRQKVRRVLILAPPSVVLQWRDEMENRFGLGFVVVDRDYFAQQRRSRGFGINPWTTHTRFILSHALVRDETYAGLLREWLGDFAAGSLLILDEAHNAAPASGQQYAVDSKLTGAIRDFAKRFEHRLFLSATPHNGHSNSFAALMELLDPQRFCRGVPVTNPKILDAVMVRRLKEDIRQIEGDFPERHVERISLDNLPKDAPELVLSQLLAEYRAAREARLAAQPKSAKSAALLVLTSLQKRLLSSIAAFARTLRVHRRAMDAAPRAAAAHYDLLTAAPGADDDRAELSEAEVAQEEDLEVDLATDRGPTERERQLLTQMTELAQKAAGLPDHRITWLLDWVRTHLCPQGVWNHQRVVIFTEYADTKKYLVEQLEAVWPGPGRILTFHGGMDDASREDIKKAFNAHPDEHPVRILICTDAAREGVNLQNYCADLIHFDIPWNPSRMEQRNGRIDRKLQRQKNVYCYYFVLPQRAEDRVLDVLFEKATRIRQELGVFPPLLEGLAERHLAGGIHHHQTDRLVEAIRGFSVPRTAVDTELEVVRSQKLSQDLDELRGLLEESRLWLGLNDEAFRQAVSAALSVLKAEPLKLDDSQQNPADPATPWRFPGLDRVQGGHGWVETLDSLRTPKPREQKWAEWRRTAALRPVVFQDPGSLDGKVVHLHLEHRVVQRLFSRFLSQGFVHDDLSRACVVLTEQAKPWVVVLGRLSLYGAGAARLHDEILWVAAEWVEPNIRTRKLAPVDEATQTVTLMHLEDALQNAQTAPEGLRDRMVAIAPQDVADLTPVLLRRGEKLAKAAEKILEKRGEQEARDMRAILEEQQGRIRETLAGWKQKEQARQLTLFSEEESRQLAADRRYQEDRLVALAQELEAEPERIRATYRVQARRLEPAGVVYLWPRAG